MAADNAKGWGVRADSPPPGVIGLKIHSVYFSDILMTLFTFEYSFLMAVGFGLKTLIVHLLIYVVFDQK